MSFTTQNTTTGKNRSIFNGMTLSKRYRVHRDLRTARQGSVVNDAFLYNTRSELTQATVKGGNYGYAYDNIGNRKTAQELEQELTYESNSINQYASISEVGSPFIPTYDEAGNQTLVKTSAGIWSVEYNAQNRPVRFTRTDGEGTTVVECSYDYMGRRDMKKVSVNGTNTLHQKYIYRDYLQIACVDLSRSAHPCLWLITWDPTETRATRPLAIQKDGTWYCYGHDLTKNVCEVFGSAGNICTVYSYTPYGEVTAEGNVSQPIQWSSEFKDEELELVYYNYRHYNPADGRWINRDPIAEQGGWNWYGFVENNSYIHFDRLGLFLGDQSQPAPSGPPSVQGPELSYKQLSKKAGKCGHFRWDIQWLIKGLTNDTGAIYQEVKVTGKIVNCDNNQISEKIEDNLKESWNIGDKMKDTWSLLQISDTLPSQGSATFTGVAYYVNNKPNSSGPITWTYQGDKFEPLCKGGVCLADNNHNGLNKNPETNSNKVTRQLKISWCCCKSFTKTKFEK